MDLTGSSAVVTGGASGLGLASVKRLLGAGVAHVAFADLPSSDGKAVAESLGERVTFVPADVRSPEEMEQVFDAAESQAPVRALVHCAGRGGAVRLVNRDGSPGDLELYSEVIGINLIGTFNVLRFAATAMLANDPGEDAERGVCVNTASIAAFDGQIGQVAYAASKGGIVGMTLPAARDLAGSGIRVVTIAPGTFDTPLLGALPAEAREALGAAIPFPNRLGRPDEYAALAAHAVENQMLNGAVIRLDGALRMPPR
jgi:NAD(P)-dependent dehydrogenase (short-subunit alcohol dehydrogenase family)